jgi:biopolymer transport protein ExbD
MKFHPTRRRRVEINVIPLIDILCMLLIFFIVTTSFKKKADFVDVTPPKSEQGTEGTPDRDKGRVSELTMKPTMAVQRMDAFKNEKFPLLIGEENLNLDPNDPSFIENLAAKLKERGTKEVILNFDESTPISVFFRFFDACEKAGASISVRTSKAGSATANP